MVHGLVNVAGGDAENHAVLFDGGDLGQTDGRRFRIVGRLGAQVAGEMAGIFEPAAGHLTMFARPAWRARPACPFPTHGDACGLA